jgi:hypothetical protein
MEERAALERAAAEVEGKRKQEEMAKKQRELVALKLRNIGKDALKVLRCFGCPGVRAGFPVWSVNGTGKRGRASSRAR